MAAPIFFLSDFGLEDAFVGVVEAVMLGIAPDSRVVQLAHGIPPQDLRRAAHQLYQAVPYLPDGAVVLAVVDPGVGSARRAVAAETERHRFVAPDNGLLDLVFAREAANRLHAIESLSHRLATTSRTFDGRDVFGPAAAHLARGVPLSALGPELSPDDRVRLGVDIRHGASSGEVLTFDRYGNAVTNVDPRGASWEAVHVDGFEIPRGDHFASVRPGEAVALVGSSGLVELAVRDGDARAALGLREGARLELR